MKLVIIGDVHGYDTWKKILEIEKSWDKVIFLGDYVDNFGTSSPDKFVREYSLAKIKTNFEEIVDLKMREPEKTVLLLGNHDWHYVNDLERYSGKCRETGLWAKEMIKDLLERGHMKIIHTEGKLLFSHAGVSSIWFEDWFDSRHLENIDYKTMNTDALDFTYGSTYSASGNSPESGPLWIRPQSLINNMYGDYIQVVGHTRIKHINCIKDKLWLCDNLEDGGEYVTIDTEHYKFTIKSSTDGQIIEREDYDL